MVLKRKTSAHPLMQEALLEVCVGACVLEDSNASTSPSTPAINVHFSNFRRHSGVDCVPMRRADDGSKRRRNNLSAYEELEKGVPLRASASHALQGRFRWADDNEGVALDTTEYVETTYGLPLDATERQRRAFFCAQKRSKLRHEAESKRKQLQRGTLARDALCKGGEEGAIESARMLERELQEWDQT